MNPYEIAQTHLPSGWPEDGVKRLAEAIEAYGREKLEEAREASYDHSCRGYLCNCSGHIMDAIRALIDQPKEKA